MSPSVFDTMEGHSLWEGLRKRGEPLQRLFPHPPHNELDPSAGSALPPSQAPVLKALINDRPEQALAAVQALAGFDVQRAAVPPVIHATVQVPPPVRVAVFTPHPVVAGPLTIADGFPAIPDGVYDDEVHVRLQPQDDYEEVPVPAGGFPRELDHGFWVDERPSQRRWRLFRHRDDG